MKRLLTISVPLAIMAFLVLAQPTLAADNDMPISVRAVLLKSQALIEKKAYASAIEILTAFYEKDNTLPPEKRATKGYSHYMIPFTIGNCCVMMDDSQAALPYYERALVGQGDFSAGWLNLAKCAYDLGRFARAATAFLKGYETANNPTGQYLYYAAASFMSAGQNPRALAVFDQILSHHGDEMKTDWKAALVQLYLALDRPVDALPLIEALTEETAGAERRRWQEIRLHHYLTLQMTAKALAYVKQLIREYPGESKWWKGLANIHLSQDDYRQALVALTIKGYLDPLTNDEKSIAAELSLALGIPVTAVRLYENIIESQSTPDNYYKLSRSYMQLHQPETALAWVEKGLNAAKSPKLCFLRARILFTLGRYIPAADEFEQAAHKKERPGEAWLMAGYAAWQAHDTGRAKKAFTKALEYKNRKQAALRALSDLKSL